MKHSFRSPVRLAALLLALALLPIGAFADGEDKSATIGIVDTISSLNPLLMDNSEIVKYATSLIFLPLVDLDRDLNFAGQLAEEISTEDNRTFTIRLRPDAAWSDGEPVTSQDVLFTFLLWTSPEIGATGLNMAVVEGTGDDGYAEPGAQELSGVQIVDEKTLTVTTKIPMALYTFEYNFGVYMEILPEHVLRDVPREEMLTSPWFRAPEVISGPYFLADYDLDHYVHYVANENYFKGAPKIKYLNFQVVRSAQIPAGLLSGELDLVQQTMGGILMEDYDTVRAMEGITTVQGAAVTNQSTFINVNNVPDVRIRRALLLGIDRETILREFVHGNGEIVDGFLVSASPYYDEALGVTEYAPEAARALIAEAKADGADTRLTWSVNSGDATFVQAVTYIAAMFADLGLTIDVRTLDLSSLLSAADASTIQIMTVQYTYAPVDPYTDVSWLLSADGWTRYADSEVEQALEDSQALTDQEEIRAKFLQVDTAVVTDVPMISMYVLSALGAVSDRLVNAVPDVYGTFLNVHEWDIAE